MAPPSDPPSVAPGVVPIEQLPLTGIRFLEVGEDFAGAYACHLLSLLGAEVVRVPSPAPEPAAGPAPGPGPDPEEARPWGLDGGKLLFTGEVSHEALAGLPVVGAIDSTGWLGSAPFPVVRADDCPNPARGWASSGAMALTGRAGGPPLLAPGDVAGCLVGASLALRLLAASRGAHFPLDGPALLGERAAIVGHHRNGDVSNGGACRMVAADDGWLAVNLSRDSDVELVPAWVEETVQGDPWNSVTSFARRRPAQAVADRAQLLGIPVAMVGGPDHVDEQIRSRGQNGPRAPWLSGGTASCPAPARRLTDLGRLGPSRPASRRQALVVDLSALWAGPLAASLLVTAGCRVLKVEDPRRPDPSRHGPRQFFDLLHGGKESVTVPVAATGPFPALVGAADVVIEASRPRALQQLGVHAAPHQAWVSITGYGRTGPWRNRVALGDDAAAGAGLVAHEHGDGPPLFCADAAADPITGLHAAVVALAAVVGGTGGITDMAMREVTGHVLARSRPAQPGDPGPVAPPRSRTPTRVAAKLGADTDAVLAEL